MYKIRTCIYYVYLFNKYMYPFNTHMYLFNTHNQMMYNTIYKKAIYDITMTDWLQKRLQKKDYKYIDYKNTTEKEYNIDYKKDYKKTAWTY